MKWHPFTHMEELLENNSYDLATDVYEKNGNIYVEMHVAGINPENIDISVEDNHLRISGSSKEKEEVSDRNYYYKEIQRGSFEKLIPLPTEVDSNKVTADVSHGVLTITLPKKTISESKKIKINKK